ncbi:hypothetical protein NB706_003261 [Xanthomonas sacchari]|nr:hypothetical protein [Xanthomonas sacchari]
MVVDGVLEARALAHRAVAQVALGGDHRGGDVEQLRAVDEADHVGHARVGLRIAMAGAHAAAEADVVAGQRAVGAEHADEAQIVGEHVHVVDRGQRETDLELARQVGVAVDRLVLLAAAGDLLLVQPDLVVGAGVGQQVFGHARGVGVERGVRLRGQRIGGDLHVAIDVAAGGQGVDQRGVDRLHGCFQLALDHPMELERLARGDAQRVVAVGGGDGIELEPLRWIDHPARGARADHELIGRLQLLPAPLLAQIAVVLLVAAVVLDQGLIVLAQRPGDRIGQALQQRPAQALAVVLDVFDGVGHWVGNREWGIGNGKSGCVGLRKARRGRLLPIPHSRFPIPHLNRHHAHTAPPAAVG